MNLDFMSPKKCGASGLIYRTALKYTAPCAVASQDINDHDLMWYT